MIDSKTKKQHTGTNVESESFRLLLGEWRFWILENRKRLTFSRETSALTANQKIEYS